MEFFTYLIHSGRMMQIRVRDKDHIRPSFRMPNIECHDPSTDEITLTKFRHNTYKVIADTEYFQLWYYVAIDF